MNKLTNGLFPSEFDSVTTKSGETWLKQYAEAVTTRLASSMQGRYNGFRQKVVRNNKYSAGKQDPKIYQTAIEGEDNVANLALFYDTANPIGTFEKNVVGQLMNQGYAVDYTSLSPESVTKFDKEFSRLKRVRKLVSQEDKLAEAGIDITKYVDSTEIFQSDDEIEIHLELNLKDDAAMAMTVATKYVFDYNKFPDIERKILTDLFRHNWGVAYVEADEDGKCIIRVPKLENMVFDYFEEEDASDARFKGERRNLSINQLKVMAGDSLTDKELFEAARSGRNGGEFPWSFNDIRYYPSGQASGYPWGEEKAVVYDLKIISTNLVSGYEIPNKRSGGMKFVRESNVKKIPKGAKRIEKPIENQYYVKYVPSIEKIFDYGISYSPRAKENGRLSTNIENDYIIFAQDIHEMSNASITDQLIGKADDWIFVKLNIMRMIAQAHPAGVAVDQIAVAAAANGFGEGNITPQGLIDIFTKRGVFVYSSMINGRALQNQNPIRDTPESTLSSLERMQAQMMGIIKEMEIISGVPFSTIGEPDKDSLIGNSRIALSNRNNTLRGLDLAYRNVLSRIASKVGACLQDAISNGHSLMDYGQAIGYGNIDAIKATKQIPLEEFGIGISVAPDAQDQQNALDALNLAVEMKLIRPSAAAFIREQVFVLPKRAIKYLAVEEKKYAELQAADADARSRASAESMAAAGKAVEEAKVMAINMEWDRKDAHLTLEYRHKQGMSHQDYMEDAKLQWQKDQAKKEQIELATSKEESGGGSNYDKMNLPKDSGSRMPAMPVQV